MKSQIRLALLLALLLAACGPAAPTTATEAGHSLSATTSKPPSFQPSTPLPSLVPSRTPIPYDPITCARQSAEEVDLSDIALVTAEIPKLDLHYFFWHEPMSVDISEEIEYCGLDCVMTKYYEGGKQEGIPHFDLIVTMNRMSSADEAAQMVEVSKAEFLPTGEPIGWLVETQISSGGLPDNSFLGFRFGEPPETELLLIASEGRVYFEFRFLQDHFVEFNVDDQSMKNFAELQMEKLRACYE